MELAQILELAGRHKARKRIGRGVGSGHGKTSGRGHKGSLARAGGGPKILREGGQMTLFRRLPKRGFSNENFRSEFAVVNVGDLDEVFADGACVTGEALVEAGLVRDLRLPIKVLGDGQITRRLTVEAARFSKQAMEKIQAAGGQAKVVEACLPEAPAGRKGKQAV